MVNHSVLQSWYFCFSLIILKSHLYIGHAVVPVANCKREKYSSQPKENKSFSDFLDYWQNYIESDYSENLDSFYLKDWHFSRYINLY